MLMTVGWTFFDDATIDLVPETFAGVSALLSPEAPEELDALVADILLPPSGVTVLPLPNDAGVTKLTVWERGTWVISVLQHGEHGASLVICSLSLPGHVSLWDLVSHTYAPVTRDPLAYMVLSAFQDLVTLSDRALVKRTHQSEGEAHAMRNIRRPRRDAQHF